MIPKLFYAFFPCGGIEMFSVVVAVQRYRVEASRRVTICFRLVSVISRNAWHSTLFRSRWHSLCRSDPFRSRSSRGAEVPVRAPY